MTAIWFMHDNFFKTQSKTNRQPQAIKSLTGQPGNNLGKAGNLTGEKIFIKIR